jgi:hypothetical protein
VARWTDPAVAPRQGRPLALGGRSRARRETGTTRGAGGRRRRRPRGRRGRRNGARRTGRHGGGRRSSGRGCRVVGLRTGGRGSGRAGRHRCRRWRRGSDRRRGGRAWSCTGGRAGFGRSAGHRRLDRRSRRRGQAPVLPVHREDRAAHGAAGPHPGLGDLGRVHPVDGGTVRTRDVHGLVLTTVPWLPIPGARPPRCPGAGRPRRPSQAASWRSFSSRWQARSPAPDAQTSGGGC